MWTSWPAQSCSLMMICFSIVWLLPDCCFDLQAISDLEWMSLGLIWESILAFQRFALKVFRFVVLDWVLFFLVVSMCSFSLWYAASLFTSLDKPFFLDSNSVFLDSDRVCFPYLSFVFLDSWSSAQFAIINESCASSYPTLFLMSCRILLVLQFWKWFSWSCFLDPYSWISGALQSSDSQLEAEDTRWFLPICLNISQKVALCWWERGNKYSMEYAL